MNAQRRAPAARLSWLALRTQRAVGAMWCSRSHWFTITFSAEFGGNDERASADHNPQPADAKDGGDEEFEYVYSDGEISGDDVEMDISGPVAPRKLE